MPVGCELSACVLRRGVVSNSQRSYCRTAVVLVFGFGEHGLQVRESLSQDYEKLNCCLSIQLERLTALGRRDTLSRTKCREMEQCTSCGTLNNLVVTVNLRRVWTYVLITCDYVLDARHDAETTVEHPGDACSVGRSRAVGLLVGAST